MSSDLSRMGMRLRMRPKRPQAELVGWYSRGVYGNMEGEPSLRWLCSLHRAESSFGASSVAKAQERESAVRAQHGAVSFTRQGPDVVFMQSILVLLSTLRLRDPSHAQFGSRAARRRPLDRADLFRRSAHLVLLDFSLHPLTQVQSPVLRYSDGLLDYSPASRVDTRGCC